MQIFFFHNKHSSIQKLLLFQERQQIPFFVLMNARTFPYAICRIQTILLAFVFPSAESDITVQFRCEQGGNNKIQGLLGNISLYIDDCVDQKRSVERVACCAAVAKSTLPQNVLLPKIMAVYQATKKNIQFFGHLHVNADYLLIFFGEQTIADRCRKPR